MKGDFARVSHNPLSHYSQVFQQQGRVLLEADWNEQGALTLHLLRSLAADLGGPCWAAGASGFVVRTVDADGNAIANPAQWPVGAGHFYVDGILCENDATTTLAAQPYAPTPDDTADGSAFIGLKGPYAIWIDVWERHLSWVEAPSLNDPALNGIDTASRAQVVWQLRAWSEPAAKTYFGNIEQALKTQRAVPGIADETAKKLDAEIAAIDKLVDTGLDTFFGKLGGPPPQDGDDRTCEQLRALLGVRNNYACPQLRVRLQPPESEGDPCVIAAAARYRGCENQLYRIEVHAGGMPSTDAEEGATFKWSRENGSVIFAIIDPGVVGEPSDGVAPLTVELQTLGRDARLGLAENDWVELIDDAYTLAQKAGALLKVTAVDAAARTVTLSVPSGVTPYLPSAESRMHALLRRWDQRDGVDARGVVPLVEGEWLALEDGIEIRFEPGAVYESGDYWVAPARVATADVIWPQEDGSTHDAPKPAAVRASGLHHAAALGGVNAQSVYRECCCRILPCLQRAPAVRQRAIDADALLPLRAVMKPQKTQEARPKKTAPSRTRARAKK